jgi:hypothetical protein
VNSAPRTLDELLRALERELRGCPRQMRACVLAEARDHVLSFVEEESAAGGSAQLAERTAVAAFGDPARIAAGVRASVPTRRVRRGALAVVAGCAALLCLTPPSLVERNLYISDGSAAVPRVIQRASADGFTVEVRGDGSVVISALPTAPVARRLAGTNVGLGCIKLLGNGKPQWYAIGSGTGSRFALRMQWQFGPHTTIGFRPPFDTCFVEDDFGHRWSTLADARWPVNVPLTAAGRRWAAEYPNVIDLHHLGNTARFKNVLRAVPPPTSDAVVRLLGPRAQPLAREDDVPAPGRVGFWTDGRARIVLSERTPLGRRLFIAYEHGRPAPNNLAQVDTGSGPPPSTTPATSPYHPPPGSEAATLGVLREPAQPTDKVPGRLWQSWQQGMGLPRQLFDRARRVLDIPGAGLRHRPLIGYLWPRTDGSVCYQVDSFGGCTAKKPSQAAANYSLAWTRNAGSMAAGIMSDADTAVTVERADGTRKPAILGRNAFTTGYARARITALVFQHRDGTSTRIPQQPLRQPRRRGSP